MNRRFGLMGLAAVAGFAMVLTAGCNHDDVGPSNAEQIKKMPTLPSNNPDVGVVDAKNEMPKGGGSAPKAPPTTGN